MRVLKWFTWKKILIIVAVLIIVAWVWKWWQDKNAPKVESMVVQKGNIRQELVLSGTVEAKDTAQLTFGSSGLLTWLGVEEGSTVKKYQAVASLDRRSVEKNLQKLLNEYSKQRADFDQTSYDNRDPGQNVPEQDAIRRILQKNQWDLENSVIDVELQTLAKQYATLTTPIAGVVTRVDPKQAGTNVGPNSAMIEIVNPQSLYFEVTADQTEVVDLVEGQPVEILLDSYDQEPFKGVVRRIGFTPVQGESGTVYDVEVASDGLLTNQKRLRLGMTGDATFIVADKNNVLIIPQTYVKTDTDGDYVVVSEKGEKRYVKLGVESDTDVEVVEGLQEGERIYN